MKYFAGMIGVAIVVGGGWYLFADVPTDTVSEGHMSASEAYAEESSVLEAREPVRADGTFTIVTSFYPLQFALERIVGERAEVVNVGAGRDPHDYRPSTQDMVRMQSSDVVVLQGAYLEPWGEEVAEQLQAERVPVVIATDAVELHEAGHEHGHDAHEADEQHDEVAHESEEQHKEDAHEDEQSEADAHADEHADEHEGDEHETEHTDEHDEEVHDEHEHGAYDPHTWLDPVLFSETVAYLVEMISTLDPAFAAEYEANGAALQAELATLDSRFTTSLTGCRYEEAIVSHDFLGYVGDRYNLAFHTIAGLSNQDMPSAVTLATLREEATEGVGAILLEENAIAAYGETLARETGLTTLSINPIAFAVPTGENYLTLQQQNLVTLVEAFGCNE
jgi:zinc transport system substrate-binding protein